MSQHRMPSSSSTNPKDAVGSVKLPLHLWPAEASALGCLGMLEGQEKYGRNNFIAGDGVICSIYIDAAKRHLDAFMAGEEMSPDVSNFHLANALASIAIIVKARAHGKMIDDRDYNPHGQMTVPWPTTGYRAFVEFVTPWVKKIKDQFKDKSPKHWTIKDSVTIGGTITITVQPDDRGFPSFPPIERSMATHGGTRGDL